MTSGATRFCSAPPRRILAFLAAQVPSFSSHRAEALGSSGGSNQAPNHTGDGNGDETMLDDAAFSGVGVALNQITRKAPKLPEVGQCGQHPTNQPGAREMIRSLAKGPKVVEGMLVVRTPLIQQPLTSH